MDETPIDRTSDIPPHTYGGGQTRQGDIRSARLEVISTADDEINIPEPSTATHSVYPYNDPNHTLSGHLSEWDDTPGAERILEMHKAGTFHEIHPDGSKVTKIFGDDFYIALKGHTLFVGGNLNIVVQGNANLLIAGNAKTKIDGDYSLIVNGNMTTRVKGNRLDYTKGTLDQQSKGAMRIFTDDILNIQSLKDMTIRCDTNRLDYTLGSLTQQSKGAMSIFSSTSLNAQSTGNVTLKAGGTGHFWASSVLYLDGSQIQENSKSSNPSALSDNNPTKLLDKDPGSGLTIAGSLVQPTVETLLAVRTDNDTAMKIPDTTLSFPKDRVPNT